MRSMLQICRTCAGSLHRFRKAIRHSAVPFAPGNPCPMCDCTRRQLIAVSVLRIGEEEPMKARDFRTKFYAEHDRTHRGC